MTKYIMTFRGDGLDPSTLKEEIEATDGAKIVDAYGPVIVVDGTSEAVQTIRQQAADWSIVRSGRVSAPKIGADALGTVHRAKD